MHPYTDFHCPQPAPSPHTNRKAPLQIAVRQFADTTVVTPGERIDHRSAAALEAELLPLVHQAIAAKGEIGRASSRERVYSSV